MTDRKKLNVKGYSQLAGDNLTMLIAVLRATLEARGTSVNAFVDEVNKYWGVSVIARSSIYGYLLKPPSFLSPRMALALAPKLYSVKEARRVSGEIFLELDPSRSYLDRQDELMSLGDLLYGQGSNQSPWGDFVHCWMRETGTSKAALMKLLSQCTLIPPGRAEELISGIAHPTDAELVQFGAIVRPSPDSLYTLEELIAFASGAKQLASCG
jgi:hypothetical protein